MAAVAHLVIAPNKCKIIPLRRTFSDALASRVRAKLSVLFPEWRIFEVVPHAKYLGIHLGPGAGLDSWRAPLRKFADRCKVLAAAASSFNAAIHLFNSRALPCILYVAQFLPAPAALLRLANDFSAKLCHVAPNSVTCSFLAQVADLGLCSLIHPVHACHATLIRAGRSTFAWASALGRMEAAAARSIDLPAA